MLQEIRIATFNVCNLALPGVKYYGDQEPYTLAEYNAKTSWIAQQIDQLDADIIGFQEIFSQAALKDVLAKTKNYREARHIGFDSAPQAGPRPGLALVSRLPIAENPAIHSVLPDGLSIPLPGISIPLTSFTRSVLHAQVTLSTGITANIFVCHLKSKRPDYRNDLEGESPALTGIAMLRSLIRRSTDALGLHMLAAKYMNEKHMPLIVIGDFNDVASAVSTQLAMGVNQCHAGGFDVRLFDSYRIQSSPAPLRDVSYSHAHEGIFETVDHILVSAEFNPASDFALGEVLEVIYLNDHVMLQRPETSDHGLVLARIGLYGAAHVDMARLPLI